MNVVSSFLLVPVVLFVDEGKDVVKRQARAFWVGSFITGTLGLLMSIASIKITSESPITHMVSSAVRGVALVSRSQPDAMGSFRNNMCHPSVESRRACLGFGCLVILL